MTEHLRQAREVAGELGLGMLAMGFQPKARRSDIDWMPKGRYAIMRRYMPKQRPSRPRHDAADLHGAGQSRLWLGSRHGAQIPAGLALQPIATALFANSPFTEGKPNGYQAIARRSGPTPIRTVPACCRSCSIPAWGSSAMSTMYLEMPMYFVYRDGKYIDVPANPFATSSPGNYPRCRANCHPQRLGRPPHHHLSRGTAEKLLEMRGADSGPWGRLCALPALWVGLLYDDAAPTPRSI